MVNGVMNQFVSCTIDKKEDILIFRSMGASSKTIGYIFLFEGWLISIVGAITGTLLGLLLCWLQITLEIIPLPNNGSFVISVTVYIIVRYLVY